MKDAASVSKRNLRFTSDRPLGKEFLRGDHCAERAMTLDLQILFNLAAGAAIAAFGWFFRQLWDTQKRILDDMKQIEVNLPINYVRRDEFFDTMREIKEMLIRISDKLDGKADK
jgi:hypothetical protein